MYGAATGRHCAIGASQSAHKQGRAADPKGDEKLYYKLVKDNAESFYKLGLRRLEDISITRGWLHVDTLERNTQPNSIRVVDLKKCTHTIPLVMKNNETILLIKRIAALLMLALGIILLLMTFTSCGSKKKVVDKTEEATEIVIHDKEEKQSEKTEESKKETDTKKEVTKETETEDFDVEIEDPTKPFELEKETKDGKTTWRGKNIKNLNNKKESSKEESKDSSATKEENKSQAKEASKKTIARQPKQKKKASNKNLEAKRFPLVDFSSCCN